jgi:peptide-methionine (S)-S-oxide reductase
MLEQSIPRPMQVSFRFRLGLGLSVLVTSTGILASTPIPASLAATPPNATSFPNPRLDLANPPGSGLQTAVLAGGCFWGVEAVFEHVRGVTNVVSGFAGGQPTTANYKAVSNGQTGHAEAVQITYDPKQVSYGQLLKVYFSIAHDPTQLNRQGPDQGSQYRSAIFFRSAQQQQIAQAYIQQLGQARVFPKPIVTQVAPLRGFYAAETYHQNFVSRNPAHPYVVFHDLPKLAQFKAQLPGLYRP